MSIIRNPKKLIEVALPLDAINKACEYEKMPGIGAHPRWIHLWWARRPLAAARAVIFAQMVNDPGYQQGGGFRFGVNKEKAKLERERLFRIIEDLVKWENTDNKEVLDRARAEIQRSWREICELNKKHPQAEELFNPDKLPGFHDPFAGGGALPLEAQRLGLESYASDLNPVAVMINKAMIEIPPRFAGKIPVWQHFPEDDQDDWVKDWNGSRGLAEDVRRYGMWLLEEARKRIGHLYPTVEITDDMLRERPDLEPLLGQKLTVIAWLWARTVKSSNPAFSHADVPLVSSFILSSKKGKEAYVEPVVQGDRYDFRVRIGTPPALAKNGTKLARGASFRCILSNTPMDAEHIRREFRTKQAGVRLMAIVAEGERGRIYLSPTEVHQQITDLAIPEWRPNISMNQECKDLISGRGYGFRSWDELFTPRQLAALTTFSDLIPEVIEKCRQDALAASMPDDGKGLDDGGTGATAYGEAIGLYLAFAIDRCADFSNSQTRWIPGNQKVMNLFSKQAIPMTWDFPEAALLENTVGGFLPAINYISKCIELLPKANTKAYVIQHDAKTSNLSVNKIISTDPPYYDNIGYADLSDFFYVWLRKNLRPIYPGLFATISTPKNDELIAASYRHPSKKDAETFFLDGMRQAIDNLARKAHPAFPVTIYYAFKQSETNEEGTSSTGWETFLQAVIESGFAITGTWPIRSEQTERQIGKNTNALSSSIVLVCRRRADDAATVNRRQFIRELNRVLPDALEEMTRGGINSPVAPVDLSQAIIGPGMEIFSQYAAVLESDGKHMTVRTALQLINRFVASEDFDADTLFCLEWFMQHGWMAGVYGQADVLARAKGTSVDGLVEAGVIEAVNGKCRLLQWRELPEDWTPENDKRLPQWEALHHLIRLLNLQGESGAGAVLARIPGMAEPIRQLAYRLYTVCEQQGRAEDARAYNELVTAWNGIEQAAEEVGIAHVQHEMDI
ncbi:MAG: DUF1156 domain-containing protein [Oxalobacter formigenes]|nr:DUF1156 domain-containing protein [Oxalobacter formigenes]